MSLIPTSNPTNLVTLFNKCSELKKEIPSNSSLLGPTGLRMIEVPSGISTNSVFVVDNTGKSYNTRTESMLHTRATKGALQFTGMANEYKPSYDNDKVELFDSITGVPYTQIMRPDVVEVMRDVYAVSYAPDPTSTSTTLTANMRDITWSGIGKFFVDKTTGNTSCTFYAQINDPRSHQLPADTLIISTGDKSLSDSTKNIIELHARRMSSQECASMAADGGDMSDGTEDKCLKACNYDGGYKSEQLIHMSRNEEHVYGPYTNITLQNNFSLELFTVVDMKAAKKYFFNPQTKEISFGYEFQTNGTFVPTGKYYVYEVDVANNNKYFVGMNDGNGSSNSVLAVTLGKSSDVTVKGLDNYKYNERTYDSGKFSSGSNKQYTFFNADVTFTNESPNVAILQIKVPIVSKVKLTGGLIGIQSKKFVEYNLQIPAGVTVPFKSSFETERIDY